MAKALELGVKYLTCRRRREGDREVQNGNVKGLEPAFKVTVISGYDASEGAKGGQGEPNV